MDWMGLGIRFSVIFCIRIFFSFVYWIDLGFWSIFRWVGVWCMHILSDLVLSDSDSIMLLFFLPFRVLFLSDINVFLFGWFPVRCRRG